LACGVILLGVCLAKPLTAISVGAPNGNIGAVSATGAIEAPGAQPVTISAANIRSVIALRIHANITATASNGTIEQVRTTQLNANSFRWSVSAAVLGSSNLPETAKAIDIGGDLEAASTAGAPVLIF